MKIHDDLQSSARGSRRIARFYEFGVAHGRSTDEQVRTPAPRTLLAHEMSRGIERALENLFAWDTFAARAVVLAQLEELPIEQVASRLELDLPETCRLLSRGLRQLRPLLANEGIPCS